MGIGCGRLAAVGTVCGEIGCRKAATGEVGAGADRRTVCPDHGGPAGGLAAIVWDGPAIALALSAAAIAVGATLMPWLRLSAVGGGELVRSLWWVLGQYETEDAGLLDSVIFGLPRVVNVGLALVAAVALLGLLPHRRAKDARATAGALAAAAVYAGYIALRVQDGAEQVSDAAAPFGSAELGPGVLLTLTGLVCGAAAAAWLASTSST